MKLQRFFKLLLLTGILVYSARLEAQNLKIENQNEKIYTIYTSPQKTEKGSPVVSIISALVSVASLIFLWYKVRAQINANHKDVIKQLRHNDLTCLRELVAKFLAAVYPPDGGKIASKEYANDDHFLLEKQLLVMLTSENKEEQELIECIKKQQTEGITNKQEWIKDIETKSQKVLNLKKTD